uniref:Uncharacterized protein n=1 Tax=Arundo donax TaxID=35708 RepID=A0A0A9A2C9_ARUDO
MIHYPFPVSFLARRLQWGASYHMRGCSNYTFFSKMGELCYTQSRESGRGVSEELYFVYVNYRHYDVYLKYVMFINSSAMQNEGFT